MPIFDHKVKLSKNGEILVKGPSVMKGYWKDKKSTYKTIKNGWLHTGDIGTIDNEKYITIIGRVNEMIVNSGGENIAPVPIEESITSFDEIDQVMIYGHNKPYLIALVNPAIEFKNNIKAIKSIINQINLKLSSEKKIRKFIFVDNPFTIETGELTPTLKMKRRVIEKKYEKNFKYLFKKIISMEN